MVDCVDVAADGIPRIGMSFESVDKMFIFYKEYGVANGFSVKRRSLTKDHNGMYKYLIFSCGRSDKYVSHSRNPINHRANSKNDCKARMTGRLNVNGKWEITLFDDDHNHELSPSQSRFFRCNREINPHVKRQLEINDIAGIRPSKSHNSLVISAGGHEKLAFLEKDTMNLISKARCMRLGEGDATAMQSYFLRMQSSTTGFFSMIDWDDDGRLKNVFWADPRSRAAYQEFGDVVTFDTTYLTNKYDMSFAPFVGVNHHGHSILLGCGLISSEDTETFVWLFRTWLACMGGVPPKGIITDQDRAMKNAIEIVFPSTKHRLCLWHIMKKVPEKLRYHDQYDDLSKMLAEAVYDSQSVDEFEDLWSLLIYMYNLQGNAWLEQLHSQRQMWVPIFVKKYFWAGMSTTGRSESMNAFFDGYVNSKTSLKQFVEQYDNALRRKVEKECEADFESLNKQIPCSTFYEMEKQVQNAYTARKFIEFQKELLGMMYCGIIGVDKYPLLTEYVVMEDVVYGEGFKKKVMFTVRYDGHDIICSCFSYEFRGIMCKHALKVFIENDNFILPEHYVLRRWRKDIKRCHTRVMVNCVGSNTTVEQRRYDELCKSFNRLADVAAENEVNYSNLLKWVETYYVRITSTTNAATINTGASNPIDPIVKRGKGRPRTVMKKKVIWRKRKGSGSRSIAAVQGNEGINVEAGEGGLAM